MSKSISIVCMLIAVVLLGTNSANACPFCPGASTTLAEQYAESDVVLLVEWIAGKPANKKETGSTTFEMLQVGKQNKERQVFNKSDRIIIPHAYDGKKGELFLLTGHYDEKLTWDDPQEMTETAFYFINQSPSPEVATKKRLLFFLKFLEYHDPIIAGDAYIEIANSKYDEIAVLAEKFPREKLRKWLTDKETPQPRLGLYGMMLGLCGTKKEISLLEKIITKPTGNEFRLGIDGVIGGYLLLRGANGLEFIEKEKFNDEKCPASETFSAMQALRFMWTYGNGRISKDRLRQSVRNLVKHPKYADLAIADLARWKDWDYQPELMKLFDQNNFEDPLVTKAVQLSIVRFLFACTIDFNKESKKPLPKHVITARKNIKILRIKAPKMMKRAEEFFSPD